MQKTSKKTVQDQTPLGWKFEPLGITQGIEILHTTKWYMHKPETVLKNETPKIHWDFEIQTNHLIPARRPDLVLYNKKKEREK